MLKGILLFSTGALTKFLVSIYLRAFIIQRSGDSVAKIQALCFYFPFMGVMQEEGRASSDYVTNSIHPFFPIESLLVKHPISLSSSTE